MRSNTRIGMATAFLAAGLAAQAYGATIDASQLPYTPSGMADFAQGNTGSGGTWSGAFENTIWDGVGSSSSTAVVDTTGIAGSNFTIKSDFEVKSYSGGTLILGVSALADSASQGGDWSSAKYYVATVRFDAATGGKLDIDTNNPSYYGSSIVPGGGQTAAWASVDDVANSITYAYSLTMNGVYDGSGNLTLNATLVDKSNAANTLTVTSQQIASGDIGTGTYFGLRNSSYWGGGDVQFSNFGLSNAVPEPTSVAVIGVAVAGLMGRRRPA